MSDRRFLPEPAYSDLSGIDSFDFEQAVTIDFDESSMDDSTLYPWLNDYQLPADDSQDQRLPYDATVEPSYQNQATLRVPSHIVSPSSASPRGTTVSGTSSVPTYLPIEPASGASTIRAERLRLAQANRRERSRQCTQKHRALKASEEQRLQDKMTHLEEKVMGLETQLAHYKSKAQQNEVCAVAISNISDALRSNGGRIQVFVRAPAPTNAGEGYWPVEMWLSPAERDGRCWRLVEDGYKIGGSSEGTNDSQSVHLSTWLDPAIIYDPQSL